ncbi:MAG: ParB N-terminal domain-containing protein [Acidilobaceae archaeon]
MSSELKAWRVVLVPIELLRPHEETEREKVLELVSLLKSSGEIRSTVLVDVKTLIVLDGHHRVEALRLLGCSLVPALLVDYDSDCVKISSWREGVAVTKNDVRRAGLEGCLMPPKTSKHSLCFQPPSLSVSLETLKDPKRSYEVLLDLGSHLNLS